jgi:uncharacterized protein (UPF0548 family)
VLRPGRPSRSSLERRLARARGDSPTYPEVGATRAGVLPPGYRHDRYDAVVGHGQEELDRAVRALRAWEAQKGVGVEVVPAGAWVEDGATVLLLIRVGLLRAVAPCRVVYVEERPDAFAFAYGTLPGHPERGEVAFALSLDEAGEVAFGVVSFSRTADPLARLGAPLAQRLQQRVTRGYAASLRAAAGGY